MKHYDAIMIGFGKGAKTLAKAYAQKGKRVAMIEQSDKMYGGTCINVGCIPSKSLVVGAGTYTYQASIQRKNELTSVLRKKNYDMLDQFDNVDIYTATASFVDAHTIQIKGIGLDEQLQGDEIFINTGSTPILPNIEGIKDTKNIFTSAELMDEQTLPKRLAIIGGGYIGLEFSSMYARYGAQVTVFEHGERLVKREDEDVASQIQKVLEKQGVSFQFSSSVRKFANEHDEVVITYQNAHGDIVKEHFNAVLLANGRKANTEALQLDKAGVTVDQRGNIIVDEHLRTNVPHIHAMGDVKGGLQFTYISLDDYRIVYDDIFGEGKRTTNNRGAIAYSLFISPTFSRVGLSEQEAKDAGYEVLTSTLPATAIPRANVNQKTDGLLKAVVDAKTKQILGCVLFCDASEEIINFVQLAMNQKVPADVIKNHIFTHPTMSEALNDLFAKY